MIWPWSRIRELRAEARGYSDTLTELLVARAGGDGEPTGSAHLTAAVEACAGMYARAFAVAEVEAEGDVADVLTPAVLASMARSLVTVGESLHVIEVRGGRVRLVPSGQWDVRGDTPDPATWSYRVELFGPSGSTTRTVAGAQVLHVLYSYDPSRPWQGVGPLTRAGLSADLLSALETRLSQEAGARSAYIVPSPADGQSGTNASLRSDLKAADGGVVLAETMAAGYGDAAGAPSRDWGQVRIGANPPDVLKALRSDVGAGICSALGVPLSLLMNSNDGTAQREAWRRFCHGSVKPMARLIADQVEQDLEVAVAFDFDSLYASDVVGRAQAFNRLVQGGMGIPEAAALAGLLADE